jgi:hypothetical protein
MFNIAKQHGGRFYKVTNPRQIPNNILKEAATVSKSAMVEETFTPRYEAESAIMKGINSLPPLLGYVGTSAKATSRVVLQSHQEDPVLATWQYGLGKSVAFTSDARQRWAAGWLGWSGFSKFWAQTVRWSMRQSTSSDLQTLVDIDKGKGKVSIEAVDAQGNFINFLNPKARLVGPDLKGQELSLDQTGPGRYEASFDARQLGTYLVNIRTQRGGKTNSQITGGVLPYSPEYNAIGTNAFLLSRLSDVGGGELLKTETAGEVFTRPRIAARAPQDIWLPLLMLAACLFPLDVAARRLLWGEDEWNNLKARLRRRPRPGNKPAPNRDEAMGRLLKTKQRAGKSDGSVEQSTSTISAEAQKAIDSSPVETSSRVTMPPPGASSPVSPGSRPAVDVPRAETVQTENTSAPPVQTPDDEPDTMERLRRAKRRARGEDT